MQTHIVPVGFDYDRLIAPLVRDQLDVDRVVLLEGAVGSEANVELLAHQRRDEPVVVEADRDDVGLHTGNVGLAFT